MVTIVFVTESDPKWPRKPYYTLLTLNPETFADNTGLQNCLSKTVPIREIADIFWT